ncbi:DUF3653 domain-containing protein [Enterovibrio paralichthyis]|uniref:DUF3653 domain-containing protein n=1 Tax=Enterovibrio paralichthyis TaxID=2853805 RepID=UPI001C447389|nr:regulator [Enterovibrio paralichthyis]
MDRKTSQNYIFRRFECGLSLDEAAKLCFKSVSDIEKWDEGEPIPPECRRLMRMYSGREICGINDEWDGWRISRGGIITPANEFLDPDRIITGNYLLQLGTREDRAAAHRVLKYSRLIRRNKDRL